MKCFFEAILFAVFAAALANTSVKPTKANNDAKKSQCNNVSYNFYSGPNTMKIEQQLAEMKEEIRALKVNQTASCSGGSNMSSDVKEQLAEIKQEIRALKVNQTAGCSDGSNLSSQVKQQLAEIKQEIRAMNENQSGCSGGKAFKNCAELYQFGKQISGVYKIDPDGLGEFEVFCDQKTAGGGWAVFQKRQKGSVNFLRLWDDYKRGFGNLNGEFWLGLDKIHRLTVSGSYKLRVDLEDFDGNTAFAEYSSFAVSNEATKYRLSLGSYSGTAGDSLGYHRGMAFSTKDRDNDVWSADNCAFYAHGAWWYKSCWKSSLNGLYLHGKISAKGMIWYNWKNSAFSVKRSEMKIRPKDF